MIKKGRQRQEWKLAEVIPMENVKKDAFVYRFFKCKTVLIVNHNGKKL